MRSELSDRCNARQKYDITVAVLLVNGFFRPRNDDIGEKRFGICIQTCDGPAKYGGICTAVRTSEKLLDVVIDLRSVRRMNECEDAAVTQ